MQQNFDIIIVGAGSAGCALAYRLAASSQLKIALLEAGSPAKNPLLHIPLGFAFLLKPHANNWNYHTQAEPHLNNRKIALPRGKVLGGCSAINGMVYVRGQADDFDRWAALGNKGWSYKDVLPYFKRSENNENGENNYHGNNGPLWVGNIVNEFPICDDLIKAAEETGIPYNPDINGATQEGAGYFPHNIKNGKRFSAATAFLNTGKQLKNLTVIPFANTHKVLIENQQAVGVECSIKGKITVLRANKEVILSAGAINSPKILELSGIGNQKILTQHNIPVIHHLPGVGENLHDHWNCYLKRSTEQGSTYFSESKPLPMLRNLFRYMIFKKGFLGNPAALIAIFYKALEDAKSPDAQIHFAPGASEVDSKGNMLPIDGITIATCGLRPTSRGHCHIISNDYNQSPGILLNYLDTEYDKQVAIAAFKKARKIASAPAFANYGGEELAPGKNIITDSEILDYIKSTGEPVHHLAGSCKMGTDDMSVVDPELRVYGINGLRVADASIMPEVVSGNTHAACVMIGEKAADAILKNHSH